MGGFAPFEGEDEYMLYRDILEVRLQFPSQFSAAAKDLIKQFCPARQVASCCGLITKPIPQKTINATIVKAHERFAGVDWKAMFNREVKAPFAPNTLSADDTSKFLKYPEADETPKELTEAQQKQFEGFGHFCASA